MSTKKEAIKKETPFFRDKYHLGDFNDDEKTTDESIVDSSGYIPTEELIKKFLTGQITGTSGNLIYEVDGSKIDDDQAFQNEAEQTAVNNEHQNIGEAELKAKLKKLRLKIAGDLKKPKQKPDQGAAGADLPPQRAAKPVQGAAEAKGQGESSKESQKPANDAQRV